MNWKEPTFGDTPMLEALTAANARRKARSFDLVKEQKQMKLNYPVWAQEWFRRYKEAWYIANVTGDQVGMRQAQKLAEGLRNKLSEMETMPKWAQEQMQKQTVLWMEANASGNVKQKKEAEAAGKAIRDKQAQIQSIAKTSPSDAQKLNDLTAKWYAAHDHGIVDDKDMSNNPEAVNAALKKYSQEASTIREKYTGKSNEPIVVDDIKNNEEVKNDNSIEKAIQITASFEGSGYANIAGNSDGQGLSLGILQWNIGQGTLQPLLRKYVKENEKQTKEIFKENYEVLVKALNGSQEDQMTWAKNINNDRNKIKADWRAQLIEMCKTKQFQDIQNNAMSNYINKAYSITGDFNLKSERGLALAFDIAVQNGGFNSKQTLSIQQKIKTGQLNEQEALKVIAQAAVDKSRVKYQNDVKSRKFTIVNGKGTVHGKTYNLLNEYNLTDQSFR